jgi:tetratricopeptide (TPR) repeat protein
MLKINLEYKNATQDFEKSLSINPFDSLALVFYPIYLFSQGQLPEAMNVCKRSLEYKNFTNVFAYFYLSTFAILERALEIQKEIKSEENIAKEYRKMDCMQMFDFTLIDKYHEKLGSGSEISKVRVQADIFALFFKMILLLEKDKKELSFDYTQNDLKKMTEIELWLLKASEKNQIDHYSLNKNLGFIYFLQNKHDKAIEYLSRGMDMIESYGNFTEDDKNPYTLLLTLYHYKNDTALYRTTIERKVKIDTDNKRLVIDFRNLAFYHFQKGNYETTAKWIEKAKGKDSDDFESMRLSAHLFYLDGMKLMTEFYGRELSRHISNPGQAYHLFLQFAVYNLIDGDAGKAYETVSLARKAYLESHPRFTQCALCDKLVDNYIKITE